jgi:hypothetical protein
VAIIFCFYPCPCILAQLPQLLMKMRHEKQQVALVESIKLCLELLGRYSLKEVEGQIEAMLPGEKDTNHLPIEHIGLQHLESL